MTEDDKINHEKLAQYWDDQIKRAEGKAENYLKRCERVDDVYSKANDSDGFDSDREFQMFWANIEVLRPITYTRAPQPVVSQRHRSQDPVARACAELLERVLQTDVEFDGLHEKLKLVRDDMVLCGRGVPWVLDDGSCIFVDRRDFLHGPGRNWNEVPWVARAAYMTRQEGIDRFGDVFFGANLSNIETNDSDDTEDDQKAKVWEIWDKSGGVTLWVTEGVDGILDISEPLINVRDFFPCPRPAYGSLKRGTLTPIPDLVYYTDQIDEINELTSRIAGLSESLRLKGFYAAGEADVSDAIENAMRQTDNKAILVPVAELAAFGAGAVKDAIIWLPVDEIAKTISALVELRRQLINDVYEITGISDIMRGQTDGRETARAQNLKAQYGAVRVREKQTEMARVARDILEIKGEIFAEKYPTSALLQMAQMNDVQTQAQVMEQATAAMQSGQEFDASGIVTVEAIDALLKGERLRPFILDVETDSTIAPDEEAEKQGRIEFLSAIGTFLQTSGAMVQQQPELGPFVAEMLKFTAGGFRAGRELGGAIDDLSAKIASMGQQPQGPTPEQMEAQARAQMEADEFELKKWQAEKKELREDTRLRFDSAKTAKDLDLKTADQALKEAELELQAMFKLEEVDIEREQQRPVALDG